MLGVLFSRYVLSHYHSRESGWYSGCPVPCSKIKSNIMKQNSPKIVVCMDGTHGFSLSWSVIDWWRGSKNFIFCLGTAYDISSMESIVNYFVVFVDRISMPPKIFFSLNLNLELWHLYKYLLPSAKGLSVYFMKFVFLH